MSISSDSSNVATSGQNFFVIRQAAGISGPFAIAGAGEPLIEVPADSAFPASAIVLPAIRPQPIGGGAKRLMDILVATLALVLAAPVMLVIAAFVLAANGGPVIFAHKRIGFGGKPFDCRKFRTMRRDASDALQQYLADNPDAAREWRETKKLKHDPRVTLIGKLLRVSSLDELPQLFNVLRGDMSCVGPRPVVADELPLYGASCTDYLSARPGITGLWQVSGRSSIGYAERVALDSHYVRNWSLHRDLTILVRTAFAVIRIDHTS
ncbi:MAG: sugar transferase [Hyphomicrobiales bacterium]|nr:sugar transferase [Hyphomicrobiales bacterium]